MKIENVIFGNLINNEEYARKVIPFLQSDYFSDQVDRTVFDLITDYVNKYNSFPTKTALDIDLNEKTGLTEEQFKRAKDLVSTLDKSEEKDMNWLVDSTEKFCKDKALYNALMQSIQIVDDNKKDSISVGVNSIAFRTKLTDDFRSGSDFVAVGDLGGRQSLAVFKGIQDGFFLRVSILTHCVSS